MEDFNKKCIITPTFSGHFCFIKKYLKSFDMYVEDKDDCVIYFVISKSEDTEFKKIISAYKNSLDIRVLFLEDILEHFSIPETPAMILSKYKKFSFQAIKKFYTMLYLENYKHFLVMDSETMWINKTNMKQMFNDFFSNPCIFYSSPSKRLHFSEANKRIMEISDFVFNETNKYWFIEQFMRFWDIAILKDFIEEYGNIYDIVKRINEYEYQNPYQTKFGFFESVLYDRFIYKHNDRYKYNIVDLDTEYQKYLSPEIWNEYINAYENRYNGCCGIYEHFSQFLNKNNTELIAKLYLDNHINIVRMGEFKNNYQYQKMFINTVKPNILTCSQEHSFGLNVHHYLLTKLKINKNISRINNNIKRFLFPIKACIKWILNIFMLVYNIFKFFIDIIIGSLKK